MVGAAQKAAGRVLVYDKLDFFRSYIKGKKIAVLGVGISNRPLTRFLAR